MKTETKLTTGDLVQIDFAHCPGPDAILINGKMPRESGVIVSGIRIGWPDPNGLVEIALKGYVWPLNPKVAPFVQRGRFVAEEDVDEFLAWRAARDIQRHDAEGGA